MGKQEKEKNHNDENKVSLFTDMTIFSFYYL